MGPQETGEGVLLDAPEAQLDLLGDLLPDCSVPSLRVPLQSLNLTLNILSALDLVDRGPELTELAALEEGRETLEELGRLLLASGRRSDLLDGLVVVRVIVGIVRGDGWERSAVDKRVGEEGPREAKVGGERRVGEREEEGREGGGGRERGRVELAATARRQCSRSSRPERKKRVEAH